MIGIVIVSHSARLAGGVLELAHEVGGPDVPMAAAGGLDLPGQPLGTDAVLVLAAIERVYSDDGVLVLMDLGSAVLSAEMAVDMLDEKRRRSVVLCEAPLVEGAVAAAVQARLGSPLDVVVAEALNGLVAKSAQLGQPSGSAVRRAGPSQDAATTQAPTLTIRLTVQNRLGLHARPAARLVQTAGRFRAEIRVTNLTAGRGPADTRSINAIMTLGIRQDDEIEVAASGLEAQTALDEIRALAAMAFGDGPIVSAAPPQPTLSAALPDGVLQGLPGSPGLAIGKTHALRTSPVAIPDHKVDDPQTEWKRLIAALERTRAQIQAARSTLERQNNYQAAAILDAHLLYLDDEALLTPARKHIFDKHLNAAAAWSRAAAAMAAQYRALDDDYLRSRVADVLEVGQQVVGFLVDTPVVTRPPVIATSGILVGPDLTVTEVAQLDPARVAGFCLAFSAPTAHSIILARAMKIPAVVGLGPGILSLPDETPVIVNGDLGQVVLNPDDVTLRDARQHIEAQRQREADAHAASSLPAVTRDGRRIEVAANIGSVADAETAVRAGAEGVGLLRTEFLFLGRQSAPGEAEQFAAYRAIAQALAGRPLIIRTLDVGGDKPLPYLDQGNELNPSLGWRAIRVCLDRPDLFKAQLKAIIRTAAEFPTRIMFPMIATLAELRAAKALLAAAQAEVNAGGSAANTATRIETGIMIEIPSAALQAAHFADEVDFFSIGTNDLTQYTLAAERGNPRVAALSDALQPAIIGLISRVVEAAHARGKWVGLCGELAGDPLAVPLLVGLGVDELSMNASAIPQAKQIVRVTNYAKVAAAAPTILALETPEAVRAALTQLSTA